MQVTINDVNFKSREELKSFTNSKVSKLKKYSSEITTCKVFYKLSNNHKSEHFECEVSAHIPGHELFARSIAGSFESALDHSISSVEKQLKKHKDKHN
ncbi:MAG: ribosome hibernation-promoting factor, HPF/YfiA family [Flavobacteriales bacterium]